MYALTFKGFAYNIVHIFSRDLLGQIQPNLAQSIL